MVQVKHNMDSDLLSNYPNLSLNKKEIGYEIIDNENNMKLTLSFDDYNNVIAECKKHPLNKILKGTSLNILDCTCGFSRDAAIMQALGNSVTSIEENPFVMALVIEAKNRINNNYTKSIYDKITFRLGNSLDFIRNTNKSFDYLYFDFMFNVNKSSLPSKKEQFLKKIVRNNLIKNINIIKETVQRVSSKIIIKEYIHSSDYNYFDIINTYKEKTVKYHLVQGNHEHQGLHCQ